MPTHTHTRILTPRIMLYPTFFNQGFAYYTYQTLYICIYSWKPLATTGNDGISLVVTGKQRKSWFWRGKSRLWKVGYSIPPPLIVCLSQQRNNANILRMVAGHENGYWKVLQHLYCDGDKDPSYVSTIAFCSLFESLNEISSKIERFFVSSSSFIAITRFWITKISRIRRSTRNNTTWACNVSNIFHMQHGPWCHTVY